MTALADVRTHTDAIIAKLEAADLVVGDGTDPDDSHGWQGGAGNSSFVPYVIVYPLPSGFYDGTLADHSDDASLAWSLVCVGSSREQAEWVAQKCLNALVAQPLSVTDRSIGKVWSDMTGGARRDDTAIGKAVFIATPRIRILSYPA